MKKILLILLAIIALIVYWGNREEKIPTFDDVYLKEFGELPPPIIPKDTIAVGTEVIVISPIAFWNEKQFFALKSNNWKDAKTPVSLAVNATAFVIEFKDPDFLKVMTPLNIEGYVLREAVTFNLLTPDSSLYFTHRDIRELKTSVDNIAVSSVNLWDHKTERRRIVAKLYHDIPFALLEEHSEYARIMTIDGQIGWCMSDFIK